MKHIFDVTFSILNQPEFDDTRKMINIIIDFRNKSIYYDEKILNEVMELKNICSNISLKDNTVMQQEQKELTIFSNPLLQFYKDNQNYCNILLSSSNEKPLFIATLAIKAIGDITKFSSINQYFSYLTFAGKDDIFDVIGIKLQNAIDGCVYLDFQKDYCGLTYKLPPLNIYSMESFPTVNDMKNMDIKVKIISPKTTLNISIQNDENDILFDSKIFNISRKILPNGDLEATWNDVTENQDIEVTIINTLKTNPIIEKAKILSSKINLSNNYDDTAMGRLRYYKVFQRLLSAKKVIYRDKDSGSYIGEAKGIESEISFDMIDKQIEIYNQLIAIQDYFKLTFSMPDSFDFELIDVIRQVYELISYGKTTMNDYSFTFKKLDNIPIGSLLIIAASFERIHLLDQDLNIKNAIIIVPKAKLTEITKKSYKFESIDSSYIVMKDKIGELDIAELPKNFLDEYIRISS